MGCVLGAVVDQLGQLLHRGRGLFKVAGGLLGAAAQVLRAQGDFAGGGGNGLAGVADVAHHGLDLAYEVVEGGGDLVDFIAALDGQPLRQVAGARADLAHGVAHAGQATQQGVHGAHGQQAGQHTDDNQGARHTEQQAVQPAQGFSLLGCCHQHPVGLRHRRGLEQVGLATDAAHLGLMLALAGTAQQIGRDVLRQIGHGLENQLLVRVGQDAALLVQQKREAAWRGVDLAQAPDHVFNRDIGPGHGAGLAAVLDGKGKGHDQLLARCCDVGRREDGLAALIGQFVPGAGGGVVVCRAVAAGHRHHLLVGAADVGQVLPARHQGLLQGRVGVGAVHRRRQCFDNLLLCQRPLAQLPGFRLADAGQLFVQVLKNEAASKVVADSADQHDGGTHNEHTGGDQPLADAVEHGLSFKRNEAGRPRLQSATRSPLGLTPWPEHGGFNLDFQRTRDSRRSGQGCSSPVVIRCGKV